MCPAVFHEPADVSLAPADVLHSPAGGYNRELFYADVLQRLASLQSATDAALLVLRQSQLTAASLAPALLTDSASDGRSKSLVSLTVSLSAEVTVTSYAPPPPQTSQGSVLTGPPCLTLLTVPTCPPREPYGLAHSWQPAAPARPLCAIVAGPESHPLGVSL